MVATQHCYFADRGTQFKHIWFHKPYQQNSNAGVCVWPQATQHCYSADRGIQFKYNWFHKPYQQNSNAAVSDHCLATCSAFFCVAFLQSSSDLIKFDFLKGWIFESLKHWGLGTSTFWSLLASCDTWHVEGSKCQAVQQLIMWTFTRPCSLTVRLQHAHKP